ncbi:hypothetical protein PIB30_066315 [Stylosanthes scabra]|uniref:SCP domain-containing protein n=1 Tax=Stylosanthes scabra TaxID=79078 RepID=A0ABU6XKT6_9FABA|nr:hypothetical protein [Stylosanthes scabra]
MIQMMNRWLKIWMVIIIFISMISLILMAESSSKEYLKAHNQVRAAVGIEPLKWNFRLTQNARKFAEKHNAGYKGDIAYEKSLYNYGINIARFFGSNTPEKDVVGLWAKQKKYYDYESNSCINNNTCDNYLQIVWRSTTSVGCARGNVFQ